MKSEAPTPSGKGRATAIAAYRRMLDAKHDKDALWQIISAYNRETPTAQTSSRATALVLGAVLETGLETAILTHCIALDDAGVRRLFSGGEDGPMNFAAKIRLGHALGIYGPDSRDDLDVIRFIRNLFAHERGNLVFMDDSVIALCDQLKWLHKFPWLSTIPRPIGPMKQFIETIRHFFIHFTREVPPGKRILYLEQSMSDIYS